MTAKQHKEDAQDEEKQRKQQEEEGEGPSPYSTSSSNSTSIGAADCNSTQKMTQAMAARTATEEEQRSSGKRTKRNSTRMGEGQRGTFRPRRRHWLSTRHRSCTAVLLRSNNAHKRPTGGGGGIWCLVNLAVAGSG